MISSIVLAVYVRQVAIVIAIIICFAAGYNIKKRFIDKEDKVEEAAEHPVYNTMDEENQNQSPGVVTAEIVKIKQPESAEQSEPAEI